jgi:hypothetical protein
MKIFTPTRKRVALNVDEIQDSEVKEVLKDVANLQNEIKNLNNGFSSQVQAAEQEAQAMIEQMNNTNQKLNEVLSSIKEQAQQLTNASLNYVQLNRGGLNEEDPKFRDSFLYLTKDAVSNLSQLLEGLKSQAGNILTVNTDGTEPIAELNMDADDSIKPELTPEKMLTSAIRKRIAELIPVVMQTVEKLNPIINQAQNVNQNNEKIVSQLQEIINAVSPAQEPEIEDTEAYTPIPTTEEVEDSIPEEEVDSASGLEERMGLENEDVEPMTEEPAEIEEEVSEEEPAEEATEEVVEEDVDLEEAPKEEESTKKEAPVEDEEAIIEEEEEE